MCLWFGLSGLYALYIWHRHKSGNYMSTLLRTEVMGSTPGRHLEITDVTNGNKKKSPGDSPNACNKCRCERYFNILSIWVKKENEKKSSNQLTSTCSPHTNSWWLHETCLPQALFHRGSKHHDSDLTEKQTELTKVPVSALDCNNFWKLFLSTEAVLFCHSRTYNR